MTSCVLDASVAAKWFLPAAQEPLWAESCQILEAYAAGRARLLVPDLFWPELGNILWKAVGRRRISLRWAQESLAALRERNIPTSPTAPLLSDAFAIASSFQRSVYDGIYVALAIATSRPLVTADERLVNALGSRFPVRWLGSF